jgi:transposase
MQNSKTANDYFTVQMFQQQYTCLSWSDQSRATTGAVADQRISPAERVGAYAPRGQTPVLRMPLTHDHLSAISALTTTDRVLMHVQDEAFCGPWVVRFLKHLLRQMPGKLLVIWDGAPIHRSKVVKEFLAQGGAERLWLEQLPGYVLELNLVEGIWRQLKRVQLRNVCCGTLSELRYELWLATTNLRHKAKVLASLPKLCGYQL